MGLLPSLTQNLWPLLLISFWSCFDVVEAVYCSTYSGYTYCSYSCCYRSSTGYYYCCRSSSTSLESGAIVGIVLGVLIFIAVMVAVVFFLIKHSQSQRTRRITGTNQSITATSNAASHPPPPVYGTSTTVQFQQQYPAPPAQYPPPQYPQTGYSNAAYPPPAPGYYNPAAPAPY